MNWQSWLGQQTPHTAIQRGGPTIWPKGAPGLIGDSLGPILHLHDDASEIFYFISGQCRMEVGDREEIFGPGDFVLVPPLVPHNIWNAGDDDLVLFWLVAPNFVDNRWRTDGFPPGAMDGQVFRGHVNGSASLPGDENISSAVHSLPAGRQAQARTDEAQEVLLYVLEGAGSVSIDGRQSAVQGHSILYVPSQTDYTIGAEKPLRYLEFRTPAS